jgi:hypothetical protein
VSLGLTDNARLVRALYEEAKVDPEGFTRTMGTGTETLVLLNGVAVGTTPDAGALVAKVREWRSAVRFPAELGVSHVHGTLIDEVRLFTDMGRLLAYYIALHPDTGLPLVPTDVLAEAKAGRVSFAQLLREGYVVVLCSQGVANLRVAYSIAEVYAPGAPKYDVCVIHPAGIFGISAAVNIPRAHHNNPLRTMFQVPCFYTYKTMERRFHPYARAAPPPPGWRLFSELVERTYPGREWRPEWAADVSFRWSAGALRAVCVWKRQSGLDGVDGLLAAVYFTEDDLFRDTAVATVRSRVGVRPNAGGGDCFFLAAAYALFGDEQAAPALRKLAAVYRVRRVGESAAFADTLNPATWAEDHAIQGLSCALQADFAFVDATQSRHTYTFLHYGNVCDSVHPALVQASFWSHAATSTREGGHFESFDVDRRVVF